MRAHKRKKGNTVSWKPVKSNLAEPVYMTTFSKETGKVSTWLLVIGAEKYTGKIENRRK